MAQDLDYRGDAAEGEAAVAAVAGPGVPGGAEPVVVEGEEVGEGEGGCGADDTFFEGGRSEYKGERGWRGEEEQTIGLIE